PVHHLGGHGIHAGAVRDVHVHGEAPAAELLGGAAGGPLVEVGDHHHGALGGEPGGAAPAAAAGGAGDAAGAAGEAVDVGGGGLRPADDGCPRRGWRVAGASSRSTVWRAMTRSMVWTVPSPICRPSTSRSRCSIGRSVRSAYWPSLTTHWWITSCAVF